jgi:hypothetical protein
MYDVRLLHFFAVPTFPFQQHRRSSTGEPGNLPEQVNIYLCERPVMYWDHALICFGSATCWAAMFGCKLSCTIKHSALVGFLPLRCKEGTVNHCRVP